MENDWVDIKDRLPETKKAAGKTLCTHRSDVVETYSPKSDETIEFVELNYFARYTYNTKGSWFRDDSLITHWRPFTPPTTTP